MPVRRHSRRVVTTIVSAAALTIGWAAAGAIPASAVAPAAFDSSSCVTTMSTVVPGVQIADPACEFNGSAYTGPFGSIATPPAHHSRLPTAIAPAPPPY